MKIVLYKPSLIRKGVDIKAIYSSKTGLYLVGTEFQLRLDKKVIVCKTPNPKLLNHCIIVPDDKIYVALTDVWVDIFSDLTCIGEFGGDEVFGMGQITSIVDKYEEQLKLRKRDRELSKALKEIEETEF